MKLLHTMIVSVVFCGLASIAFADDLYPPPYRDAPLSYHAEWDAFGHFNNPIGFLSDAESWVDDNDPATELYTQFYTHLDFDGPGWVDTDGGIQNPERPASFVANVVNWVDLLPEKWLRVQVAYTDLGAGAPRIGSVFGVGVDSPPAPQGSGDVPHFSVPVGGFSDGLSYFYEDWIIYPNPDWEQIVFDVPMGTIVQQIVIDTISIPEPSSVMLCGLGLLVCGIATVRRRSRASA